MTNQTATKVAKAIKEDRNGADFYYDPDVLAPYLQNSLGISEQAAQQTAQHIREDRDGADYYQDENLLAKYLEGPISASKEERN